MPRSLAAFRSGASVVSAGPAALQGLVPTLIVQSAKQRCDLGAECPCVRGKLMAIVGFLIRPHFDRREMVRLVPLCPDIEAHVARVFAALFSEGLDEPRR